MPKYVMVIYIHTYPKRYSIYILKPLVLMNKSVRLTLNNRARSLSTVMTVIVSKDTPHNAHPVKEASLVYQQRFRCSFSERTQ